MEEKPLKTLNLIDRLIYEVNSLSTGSSSSSTNKTAENGQQLCDAATDLTLHQSWLQLPSNTNKRKAKAPVTLENEDRIEKPAAPTNPKHQKQVVPDQENIESNSVGIRIVGYPFYDQNTKHKLFIYPDGKDITSEE